MRRLVVFGATLAVALAAVLLVDLVVFEGISRPLKYELGEKYRGWVLIQYLDPSCVPLRAEGLGEVLVVPDDGRACTSAAPRRGWHPTEYVIRAEGGSRPVAFDLISIHSTQPNCAREQFYVRVPGETSVEPEPADWRFCGR